MKTSFERHPSEVREVLFSPDGKTLLTIVGDHGEVFVWDTDAGRLQRTLEGEYEVFAVALSPDGRTLAIGTREGAEFDKGRVELWDAASGKREQTLDGHGGPVGSLAFSPDGKTLASGSQDKTVRLWDVAKSLRHEPRR